jgi:hypothetical protein
MEMSYALMAKKKDDLQTVIQMIKDAKLDIPIQFVNYRD